MATFKKNRLRGRIYEKFGSYRAFAKTLDVSPSNVTIELRDDSNMRSDTIMTWAKLLDISAEDIGYYFFEE